MLDATAERRLLQCSVLIAGLVPVSGGLVGVTLGLAQLNTALPHDVTWDSHVRFLSALLLGIGLAFWRLVPNIERAGERFRLLAFLIVLGGIARLIGLANAEVPSKIMLAALVMELGVTPLLCLWQSRIAGRIAIRGPVSRLAY